MRAFWRFSNCLVVFLLLARPVQAGCPHLVTAITLAEQNFSPGIHAAPDALVQLHESIATLNNDALLLALRLSDQANHFGDLRSFLTQLKFVTAPGGDNSFRFTEEMQADLRLSRRLVDIACPDTPPEPDIGMRAQRHQLENTLGAVPDLAAPVGRTVLTNRVLTEEQQAFLDRNFDIEKLSRLLIWVALAGTAILLLHYGLVLARLVIRQRHICSVPAELTCMMETLPGRVTVLGKLGCTFVPDAALAEGPLSEKSTDIYATLTVSGRQLSTRIFRNEGHEFGMLFTNAISRGELRAILRASEGPVRLDLSAVKGRGRSRGAFGRGALPTV